MHRNNPKYWDIQTFASSKDPDKTPQYAVSDLGLGLNSLPYIQQYFRTHQKVVQWTISNLRTSMVSNRSNRYGSFFIWKMLISFLFLHENICCGYSLEAPRRGASNEYPQHMFLRRNKKNIMWIPLLSVDMDKVSQYLKVNMVYFVLTPFLLSSSSIGA